MKAIEVTLTNEDKGCQFSNWTEPLDETYMGEDASMGEIYRAARSEYGRCRSKVYMDYKDGSVKHVGWFFVKRLQYDDCEDSYLRGAWITVSDES